MCDNCGCGQTAQPETTEEEKDKKKERGSSCRIVKTSINLRVKNQIVLSVFEFTNVLPIIERS